MFRGILWVLTGAIVTSAIVYEAQSSHLQSRWFSRFASEMTWHVDAGPADTTIFPNAGPYNERLGYSSLGKISQNLQKQGYAISLQARASGPMQEFVQWGGNPPYPEKLQSGLTILDDAGAPLYGSRQPQRIYQTFAEIPPLLVNSLLFIENRNLLDREYPERNPAVDWLRLGKVVTAHAGNLFRESQSTAGASTLATQLEKYRHSPAGLTTDLEEKLQQMVSASVRAYSAGPDTTEARRRIVRDYVNSTPLAGRAGFGEIQGIGEGLWAWYGIDFEDANRLLRAHSTPETAALRARVFKSALSLLLSQRRPSHYLLRGREELVQLTDSHLRILGAAGVIDSALQKEALAQPLLFREGLPILGSPAFTRQKAVTSVRTELLSLLNVGSFYDLDRLDLTVGTSVVSQVQQDVEEVLQKLLDPENAREMGLIGYRLLDGTQLDAVRFSVVIYESTPEGNRLRVQTDNMNTPFDLNDGSKLDLGSTAKLRTLISYLEVVETLYHRYNALPPGQPLNPENVANDPLRRWVVEQLRKTPDMSLQELLDAAMARQYSAGNTELFFTAGGQHRFNNFESIDNNRVMSVHEAFNRSVNLVFIRMMRDISRFHINEIPGIEDLLENRDNPLRRTYLERFADHEGTEYLQQFHAVYRGKRADQLIDTLASRTRATPYRLAMAFRSVQPEADIDAMAAFLAQRLDDRMPDMAELQSLYQRYGKDRFNSNDRAYLSGVHPLELWLVEYLLARPGATWEELVSASVDERQLAYAWLFKTSNRNRQQSRIRILLEQDAFAAIHRQWQRLGYPFPALVPSYATALGVSADRPAALTELMGIIVNGGRRMPMSQIESLHFAADTPYETLLQKTPGAAEQVLSPEISNTVRKALIDIVNTGTGRRLSGVFKTPGGQSLAVGGKTGTGDHRSRRFGAGGQLLGETVINRNAIFTFFIDDRFFGTILASVGGSKAQDFEFTSGLATQLLKVLEPSLQPLLQSDRELLLAPGNAIAQHGQLLPQ